MFLKLGFIFKSTTSHTKYFFKSYKIDHEHNQSFKPAKTSKQIWVKNVSATFRMYEDAIEI